MRVVVKGIERDLTVEELYEEMEAFMYLESKKWNLKMDLEEKVSVCKIAYMKAIKSYDIKRGAFITYLKLSIDREFNHIIRDNKAQKRTGGYEISINETKYSNSEGNDLTLEDTLEDEKSLYDIERVERIELIKQVLLELTEEEREYIYEFLIKERKQTEYAKENGISKITLNKRFLRAVEKMRRIAANQLAC